MRYIDSEQDQTLLADWYARGDLSRTQYEALFNWREDGGGLKKNKNSKNRSTEDNGDHMVSNARNRHRLIFKKMSQINDSAAQETHRFVMRDDPKADRIDLVSIGAQICSTYYNC